MLENVEAKNPWSGFQIGRKVPEAVLSKTDRRSHPKEEGRRVQSLFRNINEVDLQISSTLEKLTVIGVGLLANQILIPAYLPMYSLSTVATIFINLIGASIATGGPNLSESQSPGTEDLNYV